MDKLNLLIPIEAERALLGGILLHDQVPAAVGNALKSADFGLDSHRRIYRAMLNLGNAPVNIATVVTELTDRNELDAVGGASYIAGLTDGLPKLADMSHYVSMVRDKSIRRLIISGAEMISNSAMDPAIKIADLVANAHAFIPKAAATSVQLQTIAFDELLAREIKPREMLLDPIIPEQGLAMLYARRGDGKTYVGLGIAVAIAGGGTFLRWKAPSARRVLYIDGELPLKTLQERIAMIVAGADITPANGTLRLLTPDLQERPIPDLSTIEGQSAIEPMLEDVDMVVVDNLSALCRTGKENEGEGWLPVQSWALELRRRGLSVLFIHHAGKSGQQRGTSRREDLLDTVLSMKRPADYSPVEGLRAELHIEKGRGIHGEAAAPFEIALTTGDGGAAVWTMRPLEDVKLAQAGELFAVGENVRSVAEALGISRSAAGRLRKEWDKARDKCGPVPLSQSRGVGRWDNTLGGNGHAATPRC